MSRMTSSTVPNKHLINLQYLFYLGAVLFYLGVKALPKTLGEF